jgi:hypothetical protein
MHERVEDVLDIKVGEVAEGGLRLIACGDGDEDAEAAE